MTVAGFGLKKNLFRKEAGKLKSGPPGLKILLRKGPVLGGFMKARGFDLYGAFKKGRGALLACGALLRGFFDSLRWIRGARLISCSKIRAF